MLQSITSLSATKAEPMLKLLPLLFVFSGVSQAQDCWNLERSFYDCSANSGSGASYANNGDALNSNAAGLPVQPSPIGLEGIWSNRATSGKAKLEVSTIKGFEGIGFGVGSWSEGSFSSPNFRDHYLSTVWNQHYRDYETAKNNGWGTRLGAALKLPFRFLPKKIALSVGGSLGIGNVQYSSSRQIGIVVRLYFLGLGFSRSFERLTVAIPRPTIDQFSSGLYLGPIFLGYSNQTIKSVLGKTYSNTYTLHWQISETSLYLARKTYKDYRELPQTWDTFKISSWVSKHLSLGYQYGLYQNSHSASLQLSL